MKKFVLMSVLMCLAIAVNAQVPFTDYTPVIIDESRSSGNPSMRYPTLPAPRQRTQQQENFQTINAYYVNSRGAFQKIRIKVNVVSSGYGSGERVYVRGYYNPQIGMWSSMNSQATAITSYGPDPDVIKENFDWKCYILNFGTVYF